MSNGIQVIIYLCLYVLSYGYVLQLRSFRFGVSHRTNCFIVFDIYFRCLSINIRSIVFFLFFSTFPIITSVSVSFFYLALFSLVWTWFRIVIVFFSFFFQMRKKNVYFVITQFEHCKRFTRAKVLGRCLDEYLGVCVCVCVCVLYEYEPSLLFETKRIQKLCAMKIKTNKILSTRNKENWVCFMKTGQDWWMRIVIGLGLLCQWIIAIYSWC